jgi:4-hydroxybenzoate polyprenyltransferase
MAIYDFDHDDHVRATKEWPMQHRYLWVPIGFIVAPFYFVFAFATAVLLSGWLGGPSGKDFVKTIALMPLFPFTPFIVRRSMKRCPKCREEGIA